ncbi:hypothetical protein FQN52_009184 [Onygenales sp. PD_12]|nr:hypothetical protein FQN53_007271 [Emmonsiellopsis sp. PD_33]KAK2791394.1 hypothetical protein FQN51_002220 [Onygenales sp. PD_10]KAK2794102.1 hypothetical protein FQN52_009184 [Onygenales sp. PD_12]
MLIFSLRTLANISTHPLTRYTVQPNIAGYTLKNAIKFGTIASGFGVTAGIFAVFFFGEIPRVRKDILMNIPVIGGYWERSIPAEDNPF